ncbi:hypothetical protein ACSVHR_03045 [Acinetobacter nosocomialis]|uniref:hypothetical protein n=1 Tax=Acinetobacter nosocomialis TaxID=106654 RepID=UPI003F5FA3C8
MSSKIQTPYPLFSDIDGHPLDAGYIYIGEAGKNPEVYPIPVFWDEDLTIPASQPIRTRNGYFAKNGRAGKLYVADENCSITAKNKKQTVVHTDLFADLFGQKDAVKTVELVSDLQNLVKFDGRIVYVKSTVKPLAGLTVPYAGGGEFVYSNTQNLVEDGYIVVNSGSGQWIKSYKSLSVADFGARADGVTDCSAAFQAYIDSPYTSNVVHLENRAGKYVIKKEVDFKNKGLDGSGFGVQTDQSYNASIYIPTDFEGVNVFKNLMGTLRNLNVKQHTANDLVNFAHIFPYNFTVNNVNIDGFGYQIWSTKETCETRISDFTSINARKSAFYFPNTGIAHTTTYLERCHFQWGNYAYICDGDCYGFSFRDITVEWMSGGLKAKLFTNCTFDTFWCEGRQGNNNNTNKMVIEEVTGQQLLSCHAANFRFIGGWTSPHLENKALTALMGGITIHDSELFASNSTGARIVFSNTGLRTSFSDWYGGVNRRLKIQTQPTSTESGYVTPIEISTPNTGLYFTNIDDNDYRASVFRRVVGKNINSSAQYLAKETLSVNEFSAEAYNEITGDLGKFQAPLMLTWDTNIGVLKAAGWVLTKVAMGQYRLSRDTGNTKEIINGHLIVSGVHSGTFNIHRVSPIDSYTGSWNSYRVAAGFDIFFANLAGNPTDPSRFTVALTLVS